MNYVNFGIFDWWLKIDQGRACELRIPHFFRLTAKP